MRGNTNLHQFFTPVWAAQLIVDRFYPKWKQGSVVAEPTCGDGRFLMAIPPEVDAYGIEIDPKMAAAARKNSGREVIEGDIRDVAIPRKPTLVIGNPPFELAIVDSILDRFYEEMDYGGEMGFLLPAYAFQTAARVNKYAKRFSLDQVMIPRNLFAGMSKPLMFAQFTKDRRPFMGGLFLYLETEAVSKLAKQYKTLFIGNDSRASLWGELVEQALINLGGEATLQQIYSEVESNRPTENPFWREQIRKIAQSHYNRVGRGRYAIQQQTHDCIEQGFPA